jgi:serine/threonine-protein kinase
VLAPGQIIVSRYRVVQQIGRGGMGAVYLVEHVHTGDRAALKVLQGAASQDPESIERFKREARAPARIQSENVVRIIDADTAPEIGGAPFLVMELLNGDDLQKIIAQRGPMAPQEVSRVLGQVARALDKAHAMGIVHRDLKPENLFLHQREDGSSVVKILDFGISKLDEIQAPGAQYQLTRTGAVMGTPLYMATEQALGRRELIGPQTDVWSLGLIAIFLLTGEPYWRGKTVPDILGSVLSYAMYPPSQRWPQLPHALDAWLLRSCARMPDQRFRTAGEQIAQLTELLHATEVAVMSSAPTMLPMQAFTPPQITPPYATPPHVTPPHVPMYASQPPPPPYAGASTNEPMIHASQQNMRPQQGLGTGAKVAIVLSLLAAFGAMVVAGLFVMYRSMNDPAPASTYVAPTITATTVAAPTTVQAPIESLTPTATATVTATATTKIQPTATATATTHVNTGATREQCRASCKLACVDATDGMDCLTKCLMRCPR